jgi:hypothetical protein
LHQAAIVLELFMLASKRAAKLNGAGHLSILTIAEPWSFREVAASEA